MSVRPKVTIDLSGPFFERDPGRTVRGNIREMLEGLAEEGERIVTSLWPVLTGAGRAGTRGRAESLAGKPWFLHAVVSATHIYPWPGGGPKQYRGGRVEAKVGMFRRTATAIRSSRAMLSDLTLGLD